MTDLLLGGAASIGFIAILILLESRRKKHAIPAELTRRISHIAAGAFASGMAYVLDLTIYALFAVLFCAVMLISRRRNLLPAIHQVNRMTYGEVLFPLGALSALLIAQGASRIFLTAMLILTFADPAAGSAGQGKARKTNIGSVAFFLVSLLLTMFFHTQSMSTNIALSLLLTLIERISPRGTDNFTLPIMATILMRWVF